MNKAIFQFFYSSKEENLPHPGIPTRDVTNSHKQGTKTEPNLERGMENWCSCRAKTIKTAVRVAQEFAEHGDQHYLILTTRYPKTREALAVGVMPFSPKNFAAHMHEHRNRWKSHLPYVSDNRMKLCSFSDAFPVAVKTSRDGREHVPGSRCACIHVSDELLEKILRHFSTKRSRVREFLCNVCCLESRLANKNPSAFHKYSRRNGTSAAGKCR